MGSRRFRKNGAPKMRNRRCPPEFVPTFTMGHKFRFVVPSGAVSKKPITRAMLLNLYTMATTDTLQSRLITAIKLKRIEIWGTVPALGATPGNVQLEWVGTNAPSTLHSDTSNGIMPAYISTRPPIDSSDRWWSISGSGETDQLCLISCPQFSTIDVTCSIRFADDEAAVAAEPGTGAAATAGTVYWNYLDGFASKQFAPAGGVTILP